MMTRTALLATFIAMPLTAVSAIVLPTLGIAEPGHDGKWSVEIVTEKAGATLTAGTLAWPGAASSRLARPAPSPMAALIAQAASACSLRVAPT